MWFVSGISAVVTFTCIIGAIAESSPVSKCPSPLESSFQSWRPRFFLLSDIDNEPDDAQSLVRLLLYSNQFDIEGLVATTSFWLNSSTHPEHILDILDAYDEVLPNLRVHAYGYPNSANLRAKVFSGLAVYGMEGVGEGKDSEGSRALVDAVDASEEHLWVNIWGGASVLAQALWSVNATRTAEELDWFVSKLRVYSISDQDNAGLWIRRHWPQLFYIASVHHFNRYSLATWAGMSGDEHYKLQIGENLSMVSKEWIQRNIRDVGPLGKKYPEAEFIHEGDTPALLYMIQNGLSNPHYPEWGSWGGRYGPVGYGEGHFADTTDITTFEDGHVRASAHATKSRWRGAFQADFAERMQWSVSGRVVDVAHPPIAVVNDRCGLDVVHISIQRGENLTLDASNSYDLNGTELKFKWWQYMEPSTSLNTPTLAVPKLTFSSPDQRITRVALPNEEELAKLGRRGDKKWVAKELHVILEVSNGKLVSYRRVILSFVEPAVISNEIRIGSRNEL